MKNSLFENLPDVLDAKLLAQALCISKSGAYALMSQPDFPTLQIGGRMKPLPLTVSARQVIRHEQSFYDHAPFQSEP